MARTSPISLNLSFDRGVVDELAAIQFLRAVREHIEEPCPWLTW